ncbi:hypothetical protein QBZ16_002359 [Prototheca wickerhamii]|uniref:Alfin N-terminal domain-containing protein n=1 Tax=Prototheca wickerhamii TaxID=3111 RepID=A0AAD9MIC7_PROWI|nr:hypothetical protein QBZ16_002359 [Prototheca wickerhamii]
MERRDWMALCAVHSDAWLIAPPAGNGGAAGRLGQRQRTEQQAPAADRPLPTGRKLTYEDVSPALVGRQAELFWPDDGKWYLVEVHQVDSETLEAK